MAVTQSSRAEPTDAVLRRRVHELAFLNELSAAVSGEFDLGQLLKRALASVTELTGIGSGAVLLRGEDSDMWLAAEHDLPAPLERALARRPLPSARGSQASRRSAASC
jgi:GAF domain-containing protein